MILSLDHAYLTVPLENPIIPESGGPIVIYGPFKQEPVEKNKRSLHFRYVPDEFSNPLRELQNMMSSYFDVQTLGVKPNTMKLISKEDERALLF